VENIYAAEVFALVKQKINGKWKNVNLYNYFNETL